MSSSSLQWVQSAVILLSLLTLATALAVSLLMEVRHRYYLSGQARRLMRAGDLFPSVGAETLHALWLRGSQADREATEDVVLAQLRIRDRALQGAVEQAVVEAGMLDSWVRELREGRTMRRLRAALKLGYVSDPRAVEALVAATQDVSPQVRLAVVLSLGRLKNARGLTGLIRIARIPEGAIPDLTLAAAMAACAKDSASQLADLLIDSEVRLRVIGCWALSEVSDPTVLPQLLVAARDPDPEVRAKTARALSRIATRESVEALICLSRDPVWFVRIRALDALGKLGDPAGEDVVLLGLRDGVREVRYRAAAALRQIRGMKAEPVKRVITTGSNLSLESLISEWDRAGFLWNLAAGLSTRDWRNFIESKQLVEALISVGLTRALTNFVLVFPDLKVRLRLVELLRGCPAADARAELLALVQHPRCDRRVAAKIRRTFSGAASMERTGRSSASR